MSVALVVFSVFPLAAACSVVFSAVLLLAVLAGVAEDVAPADVARAGGW